MERVAFVFPGALGDLCLVLPTLRQLRSRHQGAWIIGVVSDRLRPLLRRAGVVDADANFEAADTIGLFGGTRQPAWIDGVTTLYTWVGAATANVIASVGSSVTVVAGQVERGLGSEHAAMAYARAVGWVPDREALATAASLGTPRTDGAPPPVLAMHRGAGSRAKRWATEGFAAVASWWRGEGGLVVSLRGPAEVDLPAVPDVLVHRDLDLDDLVGTLSRARAYVGHDTGPTHLAAALGIPGVAMFGPTAAARWRPLGSTVSVITADAWNEDGIPLGGLSIDAVIARLAPIILTS